jgi:hypothetical protein
VEFPDRHATQGRDTEAISQAIVTAGDAKPEARGPPDRDHCRQVERLRHADHG